MRRLRHMWPYILTTIAVAVFPLTLAGYGGHLATLALPKNSKAKRVALLLVWGLAIAGVLVFGASQVVAYNADRVRDGKDEQFRSYVKGRLDLIIQDPDRDRQLQSAASLRDWVSSPYFLPPNLKSKPVNNEVPSALPTVSSSSSQGLLVPGDNPENFYTYVPHVWGFPEGNTGAFQRLIVDKYQMKHRSQNPKPLNISFLQGDQSSYSLALFLERAFGGGGWLVHLNPRTDIGHITGIYLFQDSIESRYEGVDELRTFAKENNISFIFEEQPGHVVPGTFEIWVGRGPDRVKPQQ